MVDPVSSDSGWLLHFYTADRGLAPVDDLVPALRGVDVEAWARRNGAREGTPFLIGPDGRPDAAVNAFWRDPRVRTLAESTQRRYAFALKVWLEFLHRVGVSWRHAGERDLAAFKEWRLAAEDNLAPVSPTSFRIDLAAIARFHDWAERRYGIRSPVTHRAATGLVVGHGPEPLAATPSGVRRADVKWLTPKAFRAWRNIGLRGFTADGLVAESWRGRTEDRDVAFVDGLFGTGLRLGEWSSLLLTELPAPAGRGLARCRLAGSCAKRSRARTYWMPQKVARAVRFYAEEGSRPAAVARAQRAGRYEQVRDRWLLQRLDPSGTAVIRDEHGIERRLKWDALSPRERRRLFREGPAGLEPVWLWLNHDGTPRPTRSWNKTFDRANDRIVRAGEASASGAPAMWCRPHMLRHSFALRWYCIATTVAWGRTSALTAAEQRDYRHQLGDVWFLLATLLGHRSAETTREVYLEPFQFLQVEQLVALMDADDRAALENLVEAVAFGEPRVLGTEQPDLAG